MRPISVVIVTRNRKSIIAQCLESLALQTELPDELVVIDNNSSDDTENHVKFWAKTVKFPVRVANEKKIGYPFVYNRGLKEVKHEWIAFIDDDCIADRDWIKNAKKSLQKHKNAQVILGFSHTQKPHNIYSLATFLFNFDWKEKWTTGEKIHNYEVLDNKNILYHLPFLKKHGIRFAEERIAAVGGAAEDCELGWQLQRAGANAVYEKSIKVAHKDPDYWLWYWKKYFTSLAAFIAFSDERQKDIEQQPVEAIFLPNPKKVSFRQSTLALAKEYGNDHLWKVRFVSLVYLTVGMSYLLKYLFAFAWFKRWYIQKITSQLAARADSERTRT